MNNRQKCRSLYGLFVLILSIVILHIFLTVYWLTKDVFYSERSIFHKSKMKIQTKADEESPPTLESPIMHVTPIPVVNWNKIAKSRLPWYFKDGTKIPNKAQVNPKTGAKTLRVWPEAQEKYDRIEEQLMFVPSNYQHENTPMKKILLYNGFEKWMVIEGQNEFVFKNCPVNRCTIKANKKEASDVDAIVFHEKYFDLDHKKSDKQVWIMYAFESACFTELNANQDNAINWTATYRHDSDIVVPYGRWAYYDPSITQIYQLNRDYAQNKTKKVAMIVSNCNADNDRLFYAEELGKYIPVDVYGECGESGTAESNDFLRMLDQDYKFFLAFENSNCMDYVTTKFFVEGLRYNALPIVMGGRREDYERMAPKRSYVHVDDYESPKRLAEYLRRLDADDDLYNEYFRWKGTGEFIDTKFFCRLCAMLHDDGAPAKHYRNVNDWWRGPGVCDNAMPWRRFIEPSSAAEATVADGHNRPATGDLDDGEK